MSRFEIFWWYLSTVAWGGATLGLFFLGRMALNYPQFHEYGIVLLFLAVPTAVVSWYSWRRLG